MTEREGRLLGRISSHDVISANLEARHSYELRSRDAKIEHLEVQLRRAQMKARRLQWKLKYQT